MGRLIIERYLHRTELDEITYLLHSPDDRAGALGFGLGQEPPAPLKKFNRTLDLEKLQEAADALVADGHPKGSDAEQVEKLMLLGTSMGGARPKAVVEDRSGLWVAKFNKPQDKWNNARVEHAMLTLARLCGIFAAESKVVVVGDRDVLLVKRFDREKAKGGYTRSRMVSAMTFCAQTIALYLVGDGLICYWSRRLEELVKNLVGMRMNCLGGSFLIRLYQIQMIILEIMRSLRRTKIGNFLPAYDLTPSNPVSETDRSWL